MEKTTLFLAFFLLAQSLSAQLRDGTLLRSEQRQEFDAAQAKGDFFVSPKGNDNWSGTLPEPNKEGTDGPFLTISRAQQGVRDLKSSVYQPKKISAVARYIGSQHPYGKGKDIVVFIREGLYSLSAPLEFKPRDGGERVETGLPTGAFEFNHLRDHFVTYAAYPGEKPVITGGIEISNWKKSGNAWTAPCTQENTKTLLINGLRLTPARIPDSGYFSVTALSNNQELNFRKGDLKNWTDLANNRVVLMMRWNIAQNTIASVDEKKNIARLSRPESRLQLVPPRYYVENVKEAMNLPGEWYFDKVNKQVSFIPLPGISNPNDAHISVPVYNRLITVTGEEGKPVRNLRFHGLTFDGVTEGGTVIALVYAKGCAIGNCVISNCESTAIQLGFGCTQTRITNNLFRQLGRGAVHGRGPTETGNIRQMVSQTFIDKNRFLECGGDVLQFMYTNFTTISHNYFHKSYWPNCISCQWGNMEEEADGNYLVEYNHFEDMQNDADDTGVIKLAGLTVNSYVRNNLFHKVRRGYTNENVPVWFDCLARDWVVENNIFYDIEQRTMKLNGAYITDNKYINNELIEAPLNSPEEIIDGEPSLAASNLRLESSALNSTNSIPAGSVLKVSADLFNSGSTGFAPVHLYVNGKVFQTKSFPVVKNNSRRITFEFRLLNPGKQEISIGETEAVALTVVGDKPAIVFDGIQVTEERILAGETVRVSATAKNVRNTGFEGVVHLFGNGNELKSQPLALKPMEEKTVKFEITPDAGNYQVRIGNSAEIHLVVSAYKMLDLKKEKLLTYISAKAKPASLEVGPQNGTYKITASGSDFFHAEDAYAAIFLPRLKGDFVATVKVAGFGLNTEAWFRAGLYARNDITQSFDVEKGSLGSVLMFTTPNRAGIEYDEFGDGSMHKAASENLPENAKMPVWLKLERHGKTFSGYVSVDGKNWIIQRKSTPIAGLAETIDLGLAAGASDNKSYSVTFSDWSIKLQEDN